MKLEEIAEEIKCEKLIITNDGEEISEKSFHTELMFSYSPLFEFSNPNSKKRMASKKLKEWINRDLLCRSVYVDGEIYFKIEGVRHPITNQILRCKENARGQYVLKITYWTE